MRAAQFYLRIRWEQAKQQARIEEQERVLSTTLTLVEEMTRAMNDLVTSLDRIHGRQRQLERAMGEVLRT